MNNHAVDAVPTEQRQQVLRIDALYREWSGVGDDLHGLRRLQAAITECLAAGSINR